MVNRIEYTGKVYVYSGGMSKDMIKLSTEKLEEHGVNENDIVVIEAPEGVPAGSIMVTIWPHSIFQLQRSS